MGSYAGGHNASRPTTNDKRATLRNQKRSAALGRPAMKLLGGGGEVGAGGGGGVQLVCGRPTLALCKPNPYRLKETHFDCTAPK